MTIALSTVPPVRFHLSLNVADLERSVQFFSVLFNRPPAKRRTDYAKFEPDEPPLVLSLEPNGRTGAGTLNHVGLRLSDSRMLVAMQERLERAGIRTQRQEGVECCYARQTKFWLHDPDGTMWEIYTLDDDELDHRGQGQTQEEMFPTVEPEHVWEHRLGQPIPMRGEACDGSQDEVRLRGSFNVPLTTDEQAALLAEAKRLLKPNGRLFVRILTGERTDPSPTLSGSGAYVRYVPAKDEVMLLLAKAGFQGLRLLKYDDPPCFIVGDNKMRETHIEAFRV